MVVEGSIEALTPVGGKDGMGVCCLLALSGYIRILLTGGNDIDELDRVVGEVDAVTEVVAHFWSIYPAFLYPLPRALVLLR